MIVYLAIYGKLPFWQVNVLKLADEIEKKEPSYPEPASPDLVDFMKKLLIKDYATRMTVEQAMEHQWTTVGGTVPIEDEEMELITVTEQDVKSAIRPLQTLFMLINLRAKMKRKLKVRRLLFLFSSLHFSSPLVSSLLFSSLLLSLLVSSRLF